MLLVIEILFLIIGVWGLIAGKFPGGLFKVAFGKGEYNLPPSKARLFALLLISPLPLSFLVGFVLGMIFGQEGVTYAMIFEVVYDLAVITTAVIIARRVRQPNIVMSSEMPPPLTGFPNTKILTPAKKTGLIFLIGILGFIVFTSLGAVIITLLSDYLYGVKSTGNFWSDIFPFILMFLIISGGIVGIIQIAKRLRRG